MQYQTIVNWSQDNTVSKVLVALVKTAPEWKSPRRVTYKAVSGDVLGQARTGSDVLKLLRLTIHNRQVISEYVEKDYERSLKRFVEFMKSAAARNSLSANQSEFNGVHLLTQGAGRRIQQIPMVGALNKQAPNLRALEEEKKRIDLMDVVPNPFFIEVRTPKMMSHLKQITLTADEATQLAQLLIDARQRTALDDLVRAERMGKKIAKSIPEEARKGFRESSGEKNAAQSILNQLAEGWTDEDDRGLHVDGAKSLTEAIEFQYTVIGRTWELLRRSTGFFSSRAS